MLKYIFQVVYRRYLIVDIDLSRWNEVVNFMGVIIYNIILSKKRVIRKYVRKV